MTSPRCKSSLKLRGAASGGQRALPDANEPSAFAIAAYALAPLAQIVVKRRWPAGSRRRYAPSARDAPAAKRSYSPSSLQQFAACPYRFLLHAVFQLRPREHPARLEQMDPLTRGALFHSAQFELFRELTRADLLPVTQTRLPATLDLADQVLDRVAARYEDELAPAILRVWKSEIENLRTDLRGWLQHVAATESEWLPAHFEFGFGLAPNPDRDPASTAEEALILDAMSSARFHRSDRAPRDAQRSSHYRSQDRQGAAKPAAVRRRRCDSSAVALRARGRNITGPIRGIRPAVLLHSARRLLGCRQFRSTRKDADVCAAYFETIDNSIAEGFLPAAPQTGACAMCDYTAVCGPYEESRVKRKQSDRLDSLIEIRHSP